MSFYTKKMVLKIFLWFMIFICVSCKICNNECQVENVCFVLPDWNSYESYGFPEISRWKIEINTCNESREFFLSETDFILPVQKNIPFCVLASPITFAGDEKNKYETSFFYPAGCLYPYDKKSCEVIYLEWETGFLAKIMQNLIMNKNNFEILSEDLEIYLASFNWKKAEQIINEKIASSLISEEEAVFNPWQIDSLKLLENICKKKIIKSNFDISNTYDFQIEEIKLDENYSSDSVNSDFENILSAFVLENLYLSEKKRIFLSKGKKAVLSVGNEFRIDIEYISEKNVLKNIHFLPIYVEEL